ncbi:MAG: hypothetical protein V1781_07835 [Bacteroidota bacterium]
MKFFFIIICFLFSTTFVFSQLPTTMYFGKKNKRDKYLIALGYGIGTARWNSSFKSTEFYNKNGSVMSTEDFKFRANSPTQHYEVNVMAPIKKVRLGMGISFEMHYLAELEVYSERGEKFILFDEGLRFDKMFFQMEVPFKYDSNKKYSFNLNTHLGWFGYTNVKRFNFIDDRTWPFCFLLNTGITADYEVYPRVFIFLTPSFEYKYYNNADTEGPVEIIHRVFSVSIISGIRVNFAQ